MLDLQHQQQLEQVQQSRKEIWQDYQEQLKQNVGDKATGQTPPQTPWWGPIVPPKSIQDTRCVLSSPSIDFLLTCVVQVVVNVGPSAT